MPHDEPVSHDVVVIGGGYAGMAAALQLARARRPVAVIDAGERRNRFAAHSHGFLTQDGIPPGEIAATARDQLLRYPAVSWIAGEAATAAGARDGFTVTLAGGDALRARRLILATGVVDELPDIPGLAERWGRGVYMCPYCDGYERGGGPLGVLATSPGSLHQALMIREWGPTTFFTNDACPLDEAQRRDLAARGIAVEPTRVRALAGEAEVRLEDGRAVPLAGLFLAPRTRFAVDLAAQLGCAQEEGPLGPFLTVDALKETTTPGVFACGDAARPAASVSLAVGDGAWAGVSAHRSLVFG